MSFQARLSLFFAVIVIAPTVALAIVIDNVMSDAARGRADARVAAGMRTAFAVIDREHRQARQPIERVAEDPLLGRVLVLGDTAAAEHRLRALLRRERRLESLVLRRPNRPDIAVGSPDALAFVAVAPATEDGRALGTLLASATTAEDYAADVGRLTGLRVEVKRTGRAFAFSEDEAAYGVERYPEVVGRIEEVPEPAGAPTQIGLFDDIGSAEGSLSPRPLIGGVLIAFLLVVLLSSRYLLGALQRQVTELLEAARRVGRGDFASPIPITGRDNLAALAQEFNSMSSQLERQIEESTQSRRELEDTIRRVGEAFAAGLDPEGIVALAVETAVRSCGAEAGRAVPVDGRRMVPGRAGPLDERFELALQAAERAAFAVDPGAVSELLAELESDRPADARGPATAEIDGVHAIAIPLRGRVGAMGAPAEYLGVLSIARVGTPFTEREQGLFAYLAGQSAVSIENAHLHEHVRTQAVTDELTGLSNHRHFHDVLATEIERSRRFDIELGLVMLDIDNFKAVNDSFGHPQGDAVLSEVAAVLREQSRDIDEPARYGGEELAIILPQTDLAGAQQLAERVRQALEARRVTRIDGSGLLQITASFGVAALGESAFDKAGLIAAADAALYRAKRTGKNRVELAEAVASAR